MNDFYKPIYEELNPEGIIAKIITPEVFKNNFDKKIIKMNDDWLSEVYDLVDKAMRSYRAENLSNQEMEQKINLALLDGIKKIHNEKFFFTNEKKGFGKVIINTDHKIIGEYYFNKVSKGKPCGVKLKTKNENGQININLLINSNVIKATNIHLEWREYEDVLRISIDEKIDAASEVKTVIYKGGIKENGTDNQVLYMLGLSNNDILKEYEKIITNKNEKMKLIVGKKTGGEAIVMGSFLKNGRKAYCLDEQISSFLINLNKGTELLSFETKNEPNTVEDVINNLETQLNKYKKIIWSKEDVLRAYYGTIGFVLNSDSKVFEPRYSCINEATTERRANRIKKFKEVLVLYENGILQEIVNKQENYLVAPSKKMMI